jgi:hypothetical protein
MARRPPLDPAERLVLDLCRAIEAETGGSRLRFCGIAKVQARLPRVSTEQLDAAIAVAVDRGWVAAGGTPPHSLVLEQAGLVALAKRKVLLRR